jgi:hypothetical protein
MQTHKGILKEIGQSVAHTKKGLIVYSYLQIGDELVKNQIGITGLSGKMENQLGNEITLFAIDNHIVAVQTADGKTFSSQIHDTSGAYLGGVLCAMTLFLIPIAGNLFYWAYRQKKFNAGAALPNAIQIPSV